MFDLIGKELPPVTLEEFDFANDVFNASAEFKSPRPGGMDTNFDFGELGVVQLTDKPLTRGMVAISKEFADRDDMFRMSLVMRLWRMADFVCEQAEAGRLSGLIRRSEDGRSIEVEESVRAYFAQEWLVVSDDMPDPTSQAVLSWIAKQDRTSPP